MLQRALLGSLPVAELQHVKTEWTLLSRMSDVDGENVTNAATIAKKAWLRLVSLSIGSNLGC